MEKSVVTEKQALSLPDEEMPKSSPKETASIEEAVPTNEPKTKAKKSSKKAKASKPNANKEEILLETKEPQKAKKTTKESPKQTKSITNGGENIAQEMPNLTKMQQNTESKIAEVIPAKDDEVINEEAYTPLPENTTKQMAKPQMPQTQAQNAKNTNVLTESLAALESTQDKNSKDGRRDERKQPKVLKSNEAQSQIKQPQTEEGHVSFEESFAQYMQEEEQSQKSVETLITGEKKSKEKIKESSQEAKEEKSQKTSLSKQSTEINQTKESSRSQILYRSAMAKENIRTFAQTLREEIANYKPPLTKLSMELNPRNLGTLELTITKKGKDLHVQVVSNATAMGLFLQNQVDFRNNLTQVGFNNVDLSFSTNENGSGNGGRENGQNTSQDNANTEKGNKNSLEDSQNGEVNVMHITLPKYA
ncbi:flagellar hook-length control protein FliK [Helicobacter mastomyrinus]|uniref:Flagellar hook-length control protein FliK n=1 Tax=Helicobacter mastomyrinus TaxID=287948 RepID=A0ABZ3F706_9HELI|nr:flagellar hook-length control protein FliK [uncultured Helicobacter sp.]